MNDFSGKVRKVIGILVLIRNWSGLYSYFSELGIGTFYLCWDSIYYFLDFSFVVFGVYELDELIVFVYGIGGRGN